MRGVGTEGIFSAVKKYGENTVLKSKKGLIPRRISEILKI